MTTFESIEYIRSMIEVDCWYLKLVVKYDEWLVVRYGNAIEADLDTVYVVESGDNWMLSWSFYREQEKVYFGTKRKAIDAMARFLSDFLED